MTVFCSDQHRLDPPELNSLFRDESVDCLLWTVDQITLYLVPIGCESGATMQMDHPLEIPRLGLGRLVGCPNADCVVIGHGGFDPGHLD